MKEEFVTYEIALKLKELGFNEECFGYYHVNEGYIKGYAFCYSENSSNSDYSILAPLWQQVIDWFREKYKLLIDSPKLDEWNAGKWSVKLESLDKKIILEEHVGQPYWRIYRGFDSYEKAREQAILKAIELCK